MNSSSFFLCALCYEKIVSINCTLGSQAHFELTSVSALNFVISDCERCADKRKKKKAFKN